MSRKDTILVAVLINAGLLVVLFASALKSNYSREEEFALQPQPVKMQEVAVIKKELPQGGDEVDAALQKFSMQASRAVEADLAVAPPIAQSKIEPSTSNPFIDDLKVLDPLPSSSPVIASQPSKSPDVTSKSGYTEIKVKKGDVLEKIARQHHTTVDEILKLNALATTSLRIGQTLKIPAASVGVKKEGVAVAHASESSPKYYTVKNGDNPWTIAVKNHLKVDELLKLNNLNEEKARRLKPGDQLRIQ